jgi:serine/threonine protein kinase/Flp pilus assembly protein TadD
MEERQFINEAIRQGVASFEQVQEGLRIQKELESRGERLKIWEILAQRGLADAREVEAVRSGSRHARGYPFGPFRILGKIGEGGMGVVYRAVKEGQDEILALKVLPDRFTDTDLARRFEREARIAISLDHPNLVKAREFGQVGRRWFYSMELVEGATLAERIKSRGSIPEAEALSIASQVAEALSAIHARGLVHRDVKPDNVMIAKGGVAKLMDLGLAKSTRLDQSSLTQTGYALGTPHYMSPEQFQGAEADIRSDFYSLGATLYHMLTGHKPFRGATAPEVFKKQINNDLEDPRKIRPELSEGVCHVLEKLMARHPRDRHSSPAELLKDLALVAQGKQPNSERISLGKSVIVRNFQAPRPRPARSEPAPRIWLWAAGGAAAALLILLVVALSDSPRSPPPAPPVSAPAPDPAAELEQQIASEIESGSLNEAWKKLSGLSPDRAAAHSSRIQTAAEKLWEEARAEAAALSGRGDFEGARRRFEKFRSRAGEVADLGRRLEEELARIGEAERAAGQERDAEAQFRLLLQSIEFLEANGEFERALAILQGARATAGSSLADRIDDCVRRIKSAAKKPAPEPPPLPAAPPPANHGAHLKEARKEADAGKLDEAIARLTSLLKESPDLAEAYGLRAWCFLKKPNRPNAGLDATEAVNRNPREGFGLLVLGVLAREEGRSAAACDFLTRAIASEPRLTEAYLERGRSLVSLDRGEDALTDLGAAVRLEPSLGRARDYLLLKIDALEAAGRAEEAVKECSAWIEREPREVGALLRRAALCLKLGRSREAEADYKKVLTLDPKNSAALSGRDAASRAAAPPPRVPPRTTPAAVERRIRDLLNAAQEQVSVLPDGRARVSLTYDFSRKEQLEDFLHSNASLSDRPSLPLNGTERDPGRLQHKMAFRGDLSIRVDYSHVSSADATFILRTTDSEDLFESKGRGTALLVGPEKGELKALLAEMGTDKPFRSEPKPVRAGERMSLNLRRDKGRFTGAVGSGASFEGNAAAAEPSRVKCVTHHPVRILRLEIQGFVDPDWLQACLGEDPAPEGVALWNGRDLTNWNSFRYPFRVQGGAVAIQADVTSALMCRDRFPTSGSRFEMTMTVEEIFKENALVGFALFPAGSTSENEVRYTAILGGNKLVIARFDTEKKEWKAVEAAPAGATLEKGEFKLTLQMDHGDLILRQGSAQVRAPRLLAGHTQLHPAFIAAYVRTRLTRFDRALDERETKSRPAAGDLFNGRDLTDWERVGGEEWRVDRGSLVIAATGKPSILLRKAAPRNSLSLSLSADVRELAGEDPALGFVLFPAGGGPDGAIAALRTRRFLELSRLDRVKGWSRISSVACAELTLGRATLELDLTASTLVLRVPGGAVLKESNPLTDLTIRPGLVAQHLHARFDSVKGGSPD